MTASPGTALVTGAGRRIGAVTARTLHAAGYDLLIHRYQSPAEADALARELNAQRAGSAQVLVADLADPGEVDALAQDVLQAAPRLSLLVNNASAYFPTPLGSATQAQWEQLFNSNLRAPFFLVQALAARLAQNNGAIVNLADIYAERPNPQHALYTMTKAALVNLTRSLARDLAPAVRVNAVAPGAILWPENASDDYRQALLARIPLARVGDPADIANAVLFLARAGYVTGQVLAVDGGRSLNM